MQFNSLFTQVWRVPKRPPLCFYPSVVYTLWIYPILFIDIFIYFFLHSSNTFENVIHTLYNKYVATYVLLRIIRSVEFSRLHRKTLKLFSHFHLAILQNRKRQKVNIKHGDALYVKDCFELIHWLKFRCHKYQRECTKVDKRSENKCCRNSVQRTPPRWGISENDIVFSPRDRLAGIAC